MNIAMFVLTLVLGIAVALALVATPFIVVYRRRYRGALDRLDAELGREAVILPPQKGVYRGATAPSFPSVKNNGKMALTRERLAFVTYTGKTIDIPLDTITGLGESRVFKGSVAGGWIHLIVRTRSGEIGFFTVNNAAWLSALGQATRVVPDA